MRRILFFIAVVAVITSVEAYARTYKIAVVPWIGWSPMHVAEAKGFWKEQGLDVKVFNFPTLQEIHAALKSQLVDIGFDMIGTGVSMYMEGMPIVVIAETGWSHGGDKIIVKKNIDAAGLKGKPVGVYLNQPPLTYFLNQYLSQNNLLLGDVRIIEMAPDALADKFIGGVFRAIVCYDPDALRAEREGDGKIVATSATYKGCIPEGMVMMRDTLKKISSKDLAGIFKGWIKAAQWVADEANMSEYKDILNTHTFKDDAPYSEKDIREMFNAVKIHDKKTQLERNQSGGGLSDYLSSVKEFLRVNRMLKKEFEPDDIFENKVLVQVLEQMLNKQISSSHNQQNPSELYP